LKEKTVFLGIFKRMMKKQNFEALIGQSKKTSLFFSREKPN
jgi:hypothetical protein